MTQYRAAPLDILQQFFKTEKINNHVLHFSGTCTSGLDATTLKKATDLFIASFPLIRSNFTIIHARPVWVEKAYTADDVVSVIKTEDRTAAQNRFLTQEIDEKKGPQMKIAVLQGSETDILCVIINHMLCDAAAFKCILYQLAALYSDLKQKRAPTQCRTITDRTVSQVYRNLSFKKKFSILTNKKKITAQGNHHFSFEGDLSAPFIVRHTISKERFTAIRKYAAAQGATVNDVVMTAWIRILAETFGEPDSMPCAIDVRRFLPNGKTPGICNLVTNILCDPGSDQSVSPERMLARVKQRMDTIKNDPVCMKDLMLLEYLFKVLPYRFAAAFLKKFFRNPAVAFTNIGILDKRKLCFDNREVTHCFMTGSVKYPDYVQLSLSTFDDEAVFCINLYGTPNDRNRISTLLDSLADELQSILPSGD